MEGRPPCRPSFWGGCRGSGGLIRPRWRAELDDIEPREVESNSREEGHFAALSNACVPSSCESLIFSNGTLTTFLIGVSLSNSNLAKFKASIIRAVIKNLPANEPIGQLGELAIFRLQLRFPQQNSQRYKESLRHHIVKGNIRNSLRNGCSIQIVSSAANSHPKQNERKCCLTPSFHRISFKGSLDTIRHWAPGARRCSQIPLQTTPPAFGHAPPHRRRHRPRTPQPIRTPRQKTQTQKLPTPHKIPKIHGPRP